MLEYVKARIKERTSWDGGVIIAGSLAIILFESQQVAFEPNVIAYNAALSASEKCCQWERALRLLSELQRENFVLDVTTFNAAKISCIYIICIIYII